jgi:hypothetical protein
LLKKIYNLEVLKLHTSVAEQGPELQGLKEPRNFMRATREVDRQMHYGLVLIFEFCTAQYIPKEQEEEPEPHENNAMNAAQHLFKL